jgi:hypothetical protein
MKVCQLYPPSLGATVSVFSAGFVQNHFIKGLASFCRSVMHHPCRSIQWMEDLFSEMG